MLIGAVDADWTELSRNPFLLSLFSSSRQQLSLSLDLLSHSCLGLSLMCVWVSVSRRKGEEKMKGEKRETCVRVREKKRKKERKGEREGEGLLCTWLLGRREGIRFCHPIQP
jgi:hypothetical protein